jgi:undecaprenyl-diphosphatase
MSEVLPNDSTHSSAFDWLAVHERSLCMRFNRVGHRHAIQSLFSFISWLGDGKFWYALMGALLVSEGWAALPVVIQMMLTGLVGTAVYKGLKHLTERPRPYQAHAQIMCMTAPLDRFSFPSGHTLHAVIFSLVATAYYPMLGWVVFPFTVLVALSRLVLGLHYPTDVFAGIAIGALISWASLGLY